MTSYDSVPKNDQQRYAMEEDLAFANEGMGAFEDKAIRIGFVRKVYMLLSVQLAITFGGVLTTTLIRSVVMISSPLGC